MVHWPLSPEQLLPRWGSDQDLRWTWAAPWERRPHPSPHDVSLAPQGSCQRSTPSQSSRVFGGEGFHHPGIRLVHGASARLREGAVILASLLATRTGTGCSQPWPLPLPSPEPGFGRCYTCVTGLPAQEDAPCVCGQNVTPATRAPKDCF